MKIRFQADADLNPAIERGVVRQEPAIDWRPVQGFIADANPDRDVLRFAADDGRVLVSHDVCTIPRYFANFTASHRSPGVILIPPGTTVADAINQLLAAWLSWKAEDIQSQIWWFPT